MNQKIIELGKYYAKSYNDCFHSESTTRWINHFADLRWVNTTSEYELSDEERNNDKLRELFIDEFTKETKKLIQEKNTIVDAKGNKKTLVKRKKD